MSQDTAGTVDHNLRNIASEALRICREQDQPVDGDLMAALVLRYDAQMRWTKEHSSLESPLEMSELSSMAADAACNFMSEEAPVLANLRMQIGMHKARVHQNEVINLERQEESVKQHSLSSAICSAKEHLGDSKYVALLQKVQEYVCKKCKVNDFDSAAYSEVQACLNSIMPFSTLASFLSLAPEDKLQQLEKYSMLSLGIWLFNDYQGVAQSPTTPTVDFYVRQSQNLLSMIKEQQCTIANISGLLLKHHINLLLEAPNPDEITPTLLVYTNSVLIYHNNLELETKMSLDAVEHLKDEMDSILICIQDRVGECTTIPKEEVFPLFLRLGHLQQKLFEEQRTLIARHRLAQTLVDLFNNSWATIPQLMGPWSGCADGSTELLDLGKLTARFAPNDSTGEHAPADVQRLTWENTEKTIAMNGCCPVTLVLLRGVPVAHARTAGFIKYEGKTFTFADGVAAELFAASPNGYIQAVDGLVTKEPLLASILDSSDWCTLFSIQRAVDAMDQTSYCSFSTQTPTHFLESHIDPNYEWNAWSLRKQYADLNTV